MAKVLAELDNDQKRIALEFVATISVKWEDDETSHQDDHLGKYSNVTGPGFIDREEMKDWRPGQMRYWNPGPNHHPHNLKNWAHVKGRERAKVIKQYGSLEAADKAYVFEDYKRCEALNNGHWNYQGCIAEVTVGRVKGRSSLWGIESDSEPKYKKSVEADMIISAMDDLQKKLTARAEVE